MPSFKEGITRIFDISGEIEDDFSVVSIPQKHDSVQAKDHDLLKEGDRAFVLASEKINKAMGTVGDRMRSKVRQ
jgi:Trk K+ transport system NAD-binding subunit